LRERVSEERELWAGNRLLDKRRAPPRPVQDSSDLPLPITASGLFTPLATWKRPKGFLPHAFPRRTNYRAASFPFPTSNAYETTHTTAQDPSEAEFLFCAQTRPKNQETREDERLERLDRLDVENKKERCPNIPPLVDSSPALHNFRIPASNPLLTDSSS
jgi:hypothetical protein